MVFLHSHDVSTAFAVKIYKTYGNDSIEIIEENPYKLSEDIWGVGFKTADKLALKLNIDRDSNQRVKSGILHAIAQVVDNGNLYAEVEQLKESAYKLLEFEGDEKEFLVKRALRDLYNQDKIKLITTEKSGTHYVSLPQYYFSERGISDKIKKQSFNEKKFNKEKKINIDEVYKIIREPAHKNKIVLNEDQQKGIISCLQNKVSIITGGPGTGKTTLVKKLLDVLEKNNFSFRLAAPTGRAAKRMFESTGRNTETLHRLLEFSPSIMNFSRNEQNALDLDFLVVDEASMIDVFLMHAILKSIPAHAHLIFLGDVDQLPSVGAGNVLKDLIESEKVAVVRLTEIFRQAQDSLIIVNAHKVNRGEFPTSSIVGSKRDFIFIKENEPENVFPLIRQIYKKRLPAAGISYKISILLTPMNRGIVGTQRLNQELQSILNPGKNSEPEISRLGSVYRVGDRVMQIRNNYTKFIFNGDIGEITQIN
jgi:exodeoxyribonuclease V alpha subunit